jgi:Spy/CpxP family protein refolding chaperone
MNSLSRVQVGIYMAAIFLAGSVTGASVKAGFSHAKTSSSWGPPSVRRMQARLERELNLSPEQIAKIQPILARMSDDFKKIQVASVHEMAKVIQARNAEISKELTPEQQAKLKEIEQQRIERLNRSCR